MHRPNVEIIVGRIDKLSANLIIGLILYDQSCSQLYYPDFSFFLSTRVGHLILGHVYGYSDTYIRPKICKIFKILPSPTLGHVSMLDTFS